MLTLILPTLILGLILGLLSTYWIFCQLKVNCPNCKQPKPLKEIVILHFRKRIITGQPCRKCSIQKEQIDISF